MRGGGTPVTRSAGLVLFRRTPRLEVLIGHMGGPFWARKDARAWSIPKGEHGHGEEPLAAARREFSEELGVPAPEGLALSLGEVRQRGGKVVAAWAVEGDLDPGAVTPATFPLEWPPRSGRIRHFPELDRVEWVAPDAARERLVAAQVAFVERLERVLDAGGV
jgi:predicted NUDIX family NTP pyrophosphohydrolase